MTSPKILIVDDKPDTLKLLGIRLETEGYPYYITASDGDEALEKIREESPDLVLLDADMPRKNGFEVLPEMKRDPQTANIPAIMISAVRVDLRDIQRGLGLGAGNYLTKPFEWRELAKRIRLSLDKSKPSLTCNLQ